ncbi:IS3 family transposase [Dyadobacter sp. CY345]|uniref:IS3 family transposase n=1 Tax=Dyadobacter sp. CY345 TaxID=2909335 RepID=UPI0038D4DD5F
MKICLPLCEVGSGDVLLKHHRCDDTLLTMRMKEIANTRARYGFRRICVLLKREGFSDNHKRVYRIYKASGLNLRTKRPRRSRSAEHRLERLDTQAINKVWSGRRAAWILFRMRFSMENDSGS